MRLGYKSLGLQPFLKGESIAYVACKCHHPWTQANLLLGTTFSLDIARLVQLRLGSAVAERML